MAVRIRKGGAPIVCAAMHPELPGDTYVDDGLHHRLSGIYGVLVAEPMEKHKEDGLWWWFDEVPKDRTPEGCFSERRREALNETPQLILIPAPHIPLSCWMLGHVMRVEDPRRGLLGPRVCKRNGCTHREAGITWPVRSVPEGATSDEVSPPPKPRRETKFTASIYCGNCRTVGDYQFRKGTILHAANDFTWAEYRNGTPTDRKATIRLNDRTNGTLVECRFCKCSTALTIRERNGETS